LNGFYKFLEQLIPATVSIHTLIRRDHPTANLLGVERSGSGTLIDGDGLILTVGYVVLGAEELSVTLQRGEEAPARVVCIDHESGLAVVRADLHGTDYMTLGESSELAPGQTGLLIAATGSTERQVTEGVITGVEPFDAHWEYMLERAVLTTGENPGLGGGAFVTLDGVMTGIVSLNLGGLKDATMIIPVEYFLRNRDDILAYGQVRNRIARAWIGMHPMPSPRGLMVFGVIEDGPADVAGVRPGDLIVSLDDQEVSDRADLYRRLWQHQAGEDVIIMVMREGRRHVMPISSTDRAIFYA
jgi:S1-C subfamily serine protease